MEAQRSQYADQQLQALLHRLKKEDPNIRCPQGKKVTKMCLNQTCANALRCSDSRCQSCGKDVHRGCVMSSSLEEITEMINDKTETSREFLANIIKLEEEFIDVVRKTRKQFVENYLTSFMKEEGVTLIEKIYTEKNYKAMTGRQASKMARDLQEDVIQETKEQKQKFECFSNSLSELSKKLCQSRELNILSVSNLINSRVLELKGNIVDDIAYIQKSLNQPKGFKLLFRASQHQFKAASFHQYCDNINDTFVLVRTEFGKTIGGYCHYIWNSVTKASFYESSKKTFLLQLDTKQKMVNTSNKNLIYCTKEQGPCFGNSDFGIVDNCHTANNNSNFPTDYNHEGSHKYQQNKNTYISFTGSTNTKFRVVEYQVFQVLY